MAHKKKKNIVTPAKLKKILAAKYLKDAAESTGVSMSYCWVLRDRHGIRTVKHKRYSEEDDLKLIELYRSGFTYKDIGADLNRNHISIQSRIRYLRIKGII